MNFAAPPCALCRTSWKGTALCCVAWKPAAKTRRLFRKSGEVCRKTRELFRLRCALFNCPPRVCVPTAAVEPNSSALFDLSSRPPDFHLHPPRCFHLADTPLHTRRDRVCALHRVPIFYVHPSPRF